MQIADIGNTVIRIAKRNVADTPDVKHFATMPKLNFYKPFYLFMLGSLMGFLVETIYCFAASGEYVFRGTLLYGPMNVLYGVGVLALYFSLWKINTRSKWKVFAVGVGAGTAVEYMFSFLQETLFGTVSWDYSDIPFNFGGRVNLIYSVFWGALALIWVCKLYPVFVKLLRKIPDQFGRKLSILLFALLMLNIGISAMAVTRWTNRQNGVPAVTQTEQAMDYLYPDGHMEWLYGSTKRVGT